jgi:hypothetical protein
MDLPSVSGEFVGHGLVAESHVSRVAAFGEEIRSVRRDVSLPP